MEYAIPREHAADAVRACREILERHPVSFPVELRFVAADDALLSPAHGRDTAYVAVHVFEGMDGEAPFREVERLMAGWDGRPHWGKRSYLGARELARRYPAWDAFAAARAELDPAGRFENDWARRVFGPAHRPPPPRRSEEREALAAVGRDRVDDAAAARDEVELVEALAQLAGLGVAEPDAVADTEAGRGRAEQRRLHLAGALLAIQPQAGREHGAAGGGRGPRRRRRGSRRRARSPLRRGRRGPPAARRTRPAAA